MESPQQPTGDFEDWLRDAARRFAYPPTPSLAGRVSARLNLEHSRQGSRLASGLPRLLPESPAIRGAAVALVLAAVVLGVTVGLSQPVRSALADIFGLQRIQVVPIETPSTDSPTPGIPSGWERVAGATTLPDAQSKAGFPLRLPSYPLNLEGPDAVYFQDLQPGQQVILVYLSSAGTEPPGPGANTRFTLFQFRTEGIFLKGISPQTLVEEVEVGGTRALWFQGAAHYLQYLDAQGEVNTELRRVVEGNTLAWEVGDVTYRLETSLSQEDAIKIAESLR